MKLIKRLLCKHKTKVKELSFGKPRGRKVSLTFVKKCNECGKVFK